MSWQITTNEQGASVIEHTAAPRFTAKWITGNDPEDVAAIEGACWTDDGVGDEDTIHLFAFQWSGKRPQQGEFELLLGAAFLEIDAHVSAFLSR